MKTETLVDLLAREAGPAPRALVPRRLLPATIGGLMVSTAAAVAWLGVIPLSMFATVVPWMKIAYAGALALAAGQLTARLSRPAAPYRQAQYAALLVMGLMAAIGALWLWSMPPDARDEAVLGASWSSCSWRVLVLSLPALGGALWAVRGLAPTRLRAAGFAAGLLAGALGAIGYSLACPEASPAFVALWYTIGIVLTGAVGAALGPRVLRW